MKILRQGNRDILAIQTKDHNYNPLVVAADDVKRIYTTNSGHILEVQVLTDPVANFFRLKGYYIPVSEFSELYDYNHNLFKNDNPDLIEVETLRGAALNPHFDYVLKQQIKKIWRDESFEAYYIQITSAISSDVHQISEYEFKRLNKCLFNSALQSESEVIPENEIINAIMELE
jgi:hypothetical protein